MDNQGHGTIVAGEIAGALNQAGVVGLAYSSQLIVAKVVADRLRPAGKNDPHGVEEARALLVALTRPNADGVWREAGLEPAER